MKEILTAHLMRQSDLNTINNNEEIARELMYKAALGVYNNVKWRGKIGIVCGKGNNGGDGFALALILKQNGFESDIILAIADPSENTTAHYYYEKCRGEIKIKNYSCDFSEYDVLVDAVFGTGFSGTPSTELQELFDAYNATSAYKVSIDINSGLNSDTGLSEGCIKSDITVSIGSYKVGHFLNQAKDVIKTLVNVDIGIKPLDTVACLFEKEDAQGLLKPRENYSYKGTYGYVTLIGGSIEYSGAIKLANLSAVAVRSGAGIVRLAVPRSIAKAVMPYMLDSTLYRLSDNDGSIKYNKEEIDFIINNSTVIAYGMGTTKTEDGVSIIRHILKEFNGVLVLDAGGLRCLSALDKAEILNKRADLVLTPHLGEFKGLYPAYAEPLDVIKYAREINATVLLKGTASIISDGNLTYISTTGCAGMASGGSGDVLSGIIAALCAWKSEKSSLADIAALGAYINGYAGELAQAELCDISMCPQDTAKNVGIAISNLIK